MAVASLTVESGNDKGTRYVLAGKLTAMGRDPSNHVYLSDEEVSRYHAKIITRDNRYVIADLNSTNGTLVNGKKVSEHVLSSGDAVVVGKTVFLFEAHLEEAQEAKKVAAVETRRDDPATPGSLDRLISDDEASALRVALPSVAQTDRVLNALILSAGDGLFGHFLGPLCRPDQRT